MSTIPVTTAIRIIPRETDFLNRNVGSRGEVFFDKDSNTLRVYDGTKKGGDSLLTPDNLSQKIAESSVATVRYNVTVGTDPDGIESGNKYFLNGTYKPAITMVIGYTYVFNQDDQTNVYFPNAQGTTVNQHPLNFSADNADGELGEGTTYTTRVVYQLDGVVVNKTRYWERFSTATTRSVQITVTNDTPQTLYYWCQQHSGMGNTITVSEPGSGSGGGSGGSSGGASVEVSDTAPDSPSNGDIWYNSATAKLYVYVEDTDSSQWVQPAAPVPGSILDLGISDGTSGQILTTDGDGTFTFEDAPQGFSGDYNDLTNKPTIPTDNNQLANGAGYITSVEFADVTSKPTTIAGYGITNAQETLESGTNIKTINGTSVLGSGNITISGSGSTGNIEFLANTIDSSDSTAITFTPAVNMSSDLNAQNDLTVGQDATVAVNLTVGSNATIQNDLTVGNNLIITGDFTSQGSGTPEIFSDNEIQLTAGTRVILTQSPIKMASFTTAERANITAQNGDIIYNTTDNKFQGYENGSWVNLI